MAPSTLIRSRSRSRRARVAAPLAATLVLLGCTAAPTVTPSPAPTTATLLAADPLRGLAFAPYRDCQTPLGGPYPSDEQQQADIDTIATMANAVRIYSMGHGGAAAAEYAASRGLRVSAGVWLGREDTAEQRAANRAEIEAAVALAAKVKLESIVVGNEVLLRHDLSEAQLIAYLREVKQRTGGVPVTTAETATDLLGADHRELVGAMDYVLLHVHPYWEGEPIDGAAWHVAQVWRQVADGTGKRVVIGETGWPSAGPAYGAALPSMDNARRFLSEWRAVAQQQGIDYYYFSAADEPWKAEAGVGAHWGLLDQARQPKFGPVDLRTPVGPAPAAPTGPAPVPTQPGGSASGLPDPLGRQTAASTGSLSIYHNWPPPGTYAPSGWMGDLGTITVDECAAGRGVNATGSSTVDHGIRASYSGAAGKYNWAGVYWQHPANNWGDVDGGHDLTGMNAIEFYARGARGGERITFVVGGSTKSGAPFQDSLTKHAISVKLTTAWQRYLIDLRDTNLSRVIGGFGWTASRALNPHGASFFLDDIAAVNTKDLPRRICRDLPAGSPAHTLFVLDGVTLCAAHSAVGRYDYGVNTSANLTSWLHQKASEIRLDYPAGQAWGVAYLSVGAAASPKHQDFSSCQRLAVDVRANSPGVTVGIGMKDSHDPPDGSETKITAHPSSNWQTLTYSLASFTGLDTSSVSVVVEFVFSGATAQSLSFRNVRLLCS